MYQVITGSWTIYMLPSHVICVILSFLSVSTGIHLHILNFENFDSVQLNTPIRSLYKPRSAGTCFTSTLLWHLRCGKRLSSLRHVLYKELEMETDVCYILMPISTENGSHVSSPLRFSAAWQTCPLQLHNHINLCPESIMHSDSPDSLSLFIH